MGNVQNHDFRNSSETEEDDEDMKWISLPLSSILNDISVEGQISNLPIFPKIPIDGYKTKPDKKPSIPYSETRIQRLVQILEKSEGNKVPATMSSFPNLSCEIPDAISSSTKIQIMLQRIHTAAQRISCMYPIEKHFTLPSCPDVIQDATKEVLIGASMNMQLSMLRSLQQICPSLLERTLLDLIKYFDAFDSIGPMNQASTALRNTLDGISNLIKDTILTSENSSEISSAIGLLIALGLARGSITDILTASSYLMNPAAEYLPSYLTPSFAKLSKHCSPYKIEPPDGQFATDIFIIQWYDAAEEEAENQNVKNSNSPQGLATDGKYLYLRDGSKQGINKIGTGLHGTLAGHVYANHSHLISDIKSFKRSRSDRQFGEENEKPEDYASIKLEATEKFLHSDRSPIDECHFLDQNHLDVNIDSSDSSLSSEEADNLVNCVEDDAGLIASLTNFLDASSSSDRISSSDSGSFHLTNHSSTPSLSYRTEIRQETENFDSAEQGYYFSIVTLSDRIYVHESKSGVLEPNELVVLSCKTLKILDIYTISEPEICKLLWPKLWLPVHRSDKIFFPETLGEDITEASIRTIYKKEGDSNFVICVEKNKVIVRDRVNVSEAISLVVDFNVPENFRLTEVGFESDEATFDGFEYCLLNENSDLSESSKFESIRFDTVCTKCRIPITIEYSLAQRVVFSFTCKQPEILRLSFFICGHRLMRQEHFFPSLLSDGTNLVFVHVTKEDGPSIMAKKLEVIVCDPLNDLSVVKNFSVQCDLSEKDLVKSKMCCYGNLLAILLPESDETLSEYQYYSFINIDLSSQIILSVDKGIIFRKFKELSGTPSTGQFSPASPLGLCFDAQNDCLWGWGWTGRSACVSRWRNGYGPRFVPTTKIETGIESALQQAEYLMWELRRLSEGYGSPGHYNGLSHDDAVLEAVGHKEVDGIAQLIVCGRDYCCHECGLNIVVLDSTARKVIFRRSFETHKPHFSSYAMACFLDEVPQSFVIMIASQGMAHQYLGLSGQASLMKLGIKKSAIDDFSRGSALSFICRKGCEHIVPPQKSPNKKNKCFSKVKVRLLPPNIPLVIQAETSTTFPLVDFVLDHAGYLGPECIDEIPNEAILRRSCIISAITLLGVQMHQALVGPGEKHAAALIPPQKFAELQSLLIQYVASHPLEGNLRPELADAGTKLFATCLDVFYPCYSSARDLFDNFIRLHQEGTLTHRESFVFKILLERLSSPAEISSFLVNEMPSNYLLPNTLHCLVGIISTEMKRRFACYELNRCDVMIRKTSNELCNATVKMLMALTKQALSRAYQLITDSEMKDQLQADEKVEKGTMIIIDLWNSIGKCVVEQLAIALKVADGSVYDEANGDLMTELLPLLAVVTGLLVEEYKIKMMSSLGKVASQVIEVFDVLGKFVANLPSEPQAFQQTSSSTKCKVFESLHNYLPDTNQLITVSFPGSEYITIVFDERSATEYKYDTLIFYKDAMKTTVLHPDTPYFSGRDNNRNFPGFGGRPPLVIKSDTMYVQWTTDNSNEDWGWRFIATATYKRNYRVHKHWARDLEMRLASCGTSLASTLISSTPSETPTEMDIYTEWLEDPLLNDCGNELETEDFLLPEHAITMGLIQQEPGSLADSLCIRMRKAVMEDQGNVEPINKAVHAACAVLIRSQGLEGPALAVAQGQVRADSHAGLVKLWKNAQKMRQYFDYGDVRTVIRNQIELETQQLSQQVQVMGELEQSIPPSLPLRRLSSSGLSNSGQRRIAHRVNSGLRRGPSVYQGAEEKVVAEISEGIVQRAKYLLSIMSINHPCQSCFITPHRLEEDMLHFDIDETSEGFSKEAKLEVEQETTAQRLKATFQYRRRVAELKTQVQTVSEGEKIMTFLQCTAIEVPKLLSIRAQRTNLAISRAAGLRMAQTLICNPSSSPEARCQMIETLGSVLRTMSRTDVSHDQTHFTNLVEGCSTEGFLELVNSFAQLLEHSVTLLQGYLGSLRNQQGQRPQHDAVAIALIKICALDYDSRDYTMLVECGLLKVLENLMKATVPLHVRNVAWSLFEVLITRCVVLEDQIMDNMHSPSEFTKGLFEILIAHIEEAATVSSASSLSILSHSLTKVADISGSKYLLQGGLRSTDTARGLAVQGVEIGLQHTISFWIWRDTVPGDSRRGSALFRAREAPPEVNEVVIRGENWGRGPRSSNWNVGNMGAEGKVVQVVKSGEEGGYIVTVKWPCGAQSTYGWAYDDPPKYDLEVSEGAGGYVYMKGMDPSLTKDERDKPFSYFGLDLTAEGKLRYHTRLAPNMTYRVTASPSISAEKWTHIAVVHGAEEAKDKVFLYVDGVESGQRTLPWNMSLNSPSDATNTIVVESEHPYSNNTSQFWDIAVEGAIEYNVWFDSKSRTEESYDYVRFLRGSRDELDNFWGDQKYSGCNENSNWPGTEGRPRLQIPAEKFTVFFFSDSTNNDWGFQLFVQAVVPSAVINATNETTPEPPNNMQNLNMYPLFIGQPPSYACLAHAFSGYISDFRVFSTVLAPQDIARLADKEGAPPRPVSLREDFIIKLLSIVQQCMRTAGNYGFYDEYPGVSSLFLPKVLGPILQLLLRPVEGGQGVSLHACITRLCQVLLPRLPVCMVNSNLGQDSCLIEILFQKTIASFPATAGIDGSSETSSAKPCGEDMSAYSSALLDLIRALSISPNWMNRISQFIQSSLKSSNSLSSTMTILALLGGNMNHFRIGGVASFSLGPDQVIDECVLLAETWPPVLSVQEKMELSLAETEKFEAKWAGSAGFGSALMVVLESNPGVSQVLPRKVVSLANEQNSHTTFVSAFWSMDGLEYVIELLGRYLSLGRSGRGYQYLSSALSDIEILSDKKDIYSELELQRITLLLALIQAMAAKTIYALMASSSVGMTIALPLFKPIMMYALANTAYTSQEPSESDEKMASISMLDSKLACICALLFDALHASCDSAKLHDLLLYPENVIQEPLMSPSPNISSFLNLQDDLNGIPEHLRQFIINGQEAEKVAMMENPSDNAAVVQHATVGEVLLACDVQGDWVRARQESSTQFFWIRRRIDDRFFILPKDSYDSETDLVRLPLKYIEGESAINMYIAPSISSENPLHWLPDPEMLNAEKSFTLPASEVFKGCLTSLIPSAVKAATATATAYSRKALMNMLMHKNLSEDVFDSPQEILQLLEYVHEASDRDKDAEKALKGLDGLIAKEAESEDRWGSELAISLLNFCTGQLTVVERLRRLHVPTLAWTRTIETSHPYESNTNETWKVSFPGSRRIIAIFDKRTVTEQNCDHVSFSGVNDNRCWGAEKYSGRGNVWPGVGDQPPLLIQDSAVNVTFKSDTQNTCWGFKLKLYGIVDEPSSEDKARCEKFSKSLLVKPDLKLACRLMKLLVKKSTILSINTLYNTKVLKLIHSLLQIGADGEKFYISQFLSVLFKEANGIALRPALLSQVLVLGKAVTMLAVKMYNALDGSSVQTPLLLALINASVTFQQYFSMEKLISAESKLLSSPIAPYMLAGLSSRLSKKQNNQLGWRGSPLRWCSEGLPGWLHIEDREGVKGNVLRTIFNTQHESEAFTVVAEGPHNDSFHQFDLSISMHSKLVNPNASTLNVGLASLSSRSASQELFLYIDILGNLFYSSKGLKQQEKFCSCIRDADILTFKIDAIEGTITVYRNSACVGIAIGPKNIGACLESSISIEDFQSLRPAIQISNSVDRNHGISVVISSANWLDELPDLVSSVASISGAKARALGTWQGDLPDWYDSITKSINVLSSWNSIMYQECSRFSNKLHCTVIESPHPLIQSWSSESIEVLNASALELRFDKATDLGNFFEITLCSSLGVTVCKPNKWKNLSGAIISEYSPRLYEGDSVVRGPSWDWGDDDGGAGGIGMVINVSNWKEIPNAGVKVMWSDTSVVGLYRWNYMSMYDLIPIETGTFNEHRPIIVAGNSVKVCAAGSKMDSSSTIIAMDRKSMPVAVCSEESTIHLESSPQNLELDSEMNSVGSHWGFRIQVVPYYSQHFLANSLSDMQVQHLESEYSSDPSVNRLLDYTLVKYINKRTLQARTDINNFLCSKWENFKPVNSEMEKYPILYKHIELLADRFSTILELNLLLQKAIPLIDLSQFDRFGSAADLILKYRELVLRAIKDSILEGAVSATACVNAETKLTLSRSQAAKHIRLGETDWEARWSVFGQAFRALRTQQSKFFRISLKTKLYETIFAGESAHDAGGPYRESFEMYALELQSTALPLLLRTPNNKHATGLVGRDHWLLNPGATSPLLLEMLVFLGKLMGCAIRTKEFLALSLSPIVWKSLVRQDLTREDLAGVDMQLVQSMDAVRGKPNGTTSPLTEQTFSEAVMETFTAISLDGREVELKEGGRFEPVVWENRLEYASLVEQQRLTESIAQIDAVRTGLGMVVPMSILLLYTGEELEESVCGTPVIDISLLEKVVEYSGCRKEDAHIKLFWSALKQFEQHELALFLRFCWGRTRLPQSESQFSQSFKLQSFGRTPPDNYLPVAHTCFFSLELPAYSTLEIMKMKLKYAINNCRAIDADDTAVARDAAAMGFED